jgi:hypothetical protein
MGISDFIYKLAPSRISIPIILHIIIFSGIIYISKQESWVSVAKNFNDALPILTTVTVTSFYLIILVSYIFLCLKFQKKLKPKFGILWDIKKEPYCPIHEKPLTRHKVGMNDKVVAGLNCPECKQSFQIIRDNGERLTLEEAKKQI